MSGGHLHADCWWAHAVPWSITQNFSALLQDTIQPLDTVSQRTVPENEQSLLRLMTMLSVRELAQMVSCVLVWGKNQTTLLAVATIAKVEMRLGHAKAICNSSSQYRSIIC